MKSNQKIAVLSGDDTNFTKTTTAKNMKGYLKSQFKDVKILAIEDAEKLPDGEDSRIQADGDSLRELIRTMMRMKSDSALIVDVGGSNFSALMTAMSEFDGVEQRFTKYVVPITANVKPEVALGNIKSFIEKGVDPAKIIVVFSKISAIEEKKIPQTFKIIFDGAGIFGYRICSEPIRQSTLIAKLRGTPISIEELATDKTDYEKLASTEKDDAKADALTDKAINKDMAKMVKKNLDTVFSQILAVGQE